MRLRFDHRISFRFAHGILFRFADGRRGPLCLVAILFAAVIATATVARADSAAAGPQPRLVLVNPVYNFGTVLGGPPIKHTFTIRNEGKGELIIGQVMASCGCTAAKPATMRLAPGHSTQIAVQVDSSVLHGESVHTVSILTNDPKMPDAELKLVGIVQLQVTATPAEVDFGKVPRGGVVARTLVLTPYNPAGFKIGDIKNQNSSIKIERTPTVVPGNGVELKLTMDKPTQVGPFVDTIDIPTNRVEVNVSAFGAVTGELAINPPQVSFGIVQSNQPATRLVRLTNSGDRDVKITSIDTSNTSVTAEVEPVKPGKEYKVSVELRQNTPDGQVRGQIVLKTDDPDQPTVTIPYYGIVGAYRG